MMRGGCGAGGSIALEGKSKLNIESTSLQVILIVKGYF